LIKAFFVTIPTNGNSSPCAAISAIPYTWVIGKRISQRTGGNPPGLNAAHDPDVVFQ
jgi:hypothetical protein